MVDSGEGRETEETYVVYWMVHIKLKNNAKGGGDVTFGVFSSLKTGKRSDETGVVAFNGGSASSTSYL